MIESNTIIGLLTGSLATLLLKEVINQFNKKQDFHRELKKATYLKKLEKSENAVAYYYTYLGNVTGIKNSLEVIVKIINELNEKNRDFSVIQEILNKTSLSLSELSSEKHVSMNSIHLYFELDDDEFWNDDDATNLYISLSEIKSIDNDLMFWNNLHLKALNEGKEEQADLYLDTGFALFPNYVSAVQKYIEVVNKNQNAFKQYIKIIKQQLKQY